MKRLFIVNFLFLWGFSSLSWAVLSSDEVKSSIKRDALRAEGLNKKEASASAFKRLAHAIDKIESGADVNLADSKGISALMLAVHVNCFDAVDYLLSQGADPEQKAKIGKSALEFAREERIKTLLMENTPLLRNEKEALAWIEKRRAILEKELGDFDNREYRKGLDVEKRFDLLEIAQQKAALGSMKKIIEEKLMEGADINAYKYYSRPIFSVNGDGQMAGLTYCATPLSLACRVGSASLVRLILKKNASVHTSEDAQLRGTLGGTPLENAVTSGNLSLVKLLFERDADIEKEKSKHSLVDNAVSTGNVELLRFLLEKGCVLEKGERNDSLTYHAMAHGGKKSREMVEFLISQGAGSLDCALAAALGDEDRENVEYFKGKGAKIGSQAVARVAQNRKNGEEALKALIKQGIPETELGEGIVNIMNVAQFMDLDMAPRVEIIIQEGGVSPKTIEQGSAWQYLAYCLDNKWVKEYMKKMLDVFLRNKVNINAVSGRNLETLLMRVVKQKGDGCPLDYVDYLLSKGADPHIKDNKGKTALDYAQKEEVKALLLSKMKK